MNELQAKKIIESFKLHVTPCADNIFKVINTNEIVNLDQLKYALGNCTLLASINGDYKTMSNGLDELYTNVYYILTTSSNMDSEIICKYEDISNKEHEDSTLFFNRPRKEAVGSIDTLFI